MTLLRKSLLVLAALVVVLVVAAAIFVYTFDANRYRGMVLAQLSQSVHRPVEAADLKLQLLPLQLRLNQIRIAEDPNFAGKEFIRAEAVLFDLSLWSLLRGQPEMMALELNQPTINLRQNPDRQWNVATLAAAPTPTAAPPAAEVAPGPAPVRNWRVREGTIVIERAGQPPLRLTGVEVEVNDLSTSQPFPFRLGVNFASDSRVSAEGKLGPLDFAAPARTPVTADVELENFRPAALASLVAVPAGLARLGALEGKVKVESSPEKLLLAGKVDLLGAQSDDKMGVELSVSFPADFSRVELRDTTVSYRGAQVTGNGSVALAPGGAFDLTLATSDADLGALLRIPPRLGMALPFVPPPATGKLTTQLKLSGTPNEWLVTGTTKVHDLAVPLEGLKQPLRVAALELTLEPERIVAAPFSVSPEPGLNLTVSGSVTDYRRQPMLEARIGGGEVPLEPLLALAARFGVKPLGEGQQVSGFVTPDLQVAGPLAAPAGMTYHGTLKFRNLGVKLPELAKPLQIPSLVLQLDPQRLTAAPFTLSPDPGVNLTLAGTVDDYRGQANMQARVTGEEVPVGPVLALVARFGKNPLGAGQTLSGRVRPTLDLSGPLHEPGKISYQGTLAFRDLSLTTPQLPEPVRIPALELALDPKRLSTQPFNAEVGAKLRAQVTLRLDNYQTKPVLQARLVTEGADLEALVGLVRALGSDPLPGGKASGRITATIDVSGLLGEKALPLSFNGQAQLAAAAVQPAGLTEPLRIEQANFNFGSNWLDATNLRVTAAGAKLEGSFRVDNFDAPRVRFDLRGDTLDVDALQALFGAQPAGPPTVPPKRRRVSELFLPVVHAQERSDGWFARLTGRGHLEFDRVRQGTLTLAPFTAPVAVANQVVTCEPIDFGLYQGGGRGRLVVDLRGAEPVTEFNGLLRNVDVNELLSANSDSKNRFYGRLGGTVQVRFVGSERPRILQSARGQGQVSLMSGRLAQVNLSREVVAAGQLVGLSYDRRDTPIEDMVTKFEIADGWVRTNDLTLRTPDLTMTAVGGFSLEDELAFQSTATFTPEASQQMTSRSPLAGITGAFFTDGQGRVVVPFLVRGTFGQPKFELDGARLAEMKLRGGRPGPGGGGTLGDILDRIRKRKPPPQ